MKSKTLLTLLFVILFPIYAYCYDYNKKSMECNFPEVETRCQMYSTKYECKTLAVRMSHVVDGDSVIVTPRFSDKNIECKLYGIDAPELGNLDKVGQPHAKEAAYNLRLHASKKELCLLKIIKNNKQFYCVLYNNGADINLAMLKTGNVWAYKKHLSKKLYPDAYMEAQESAKQNRLGLWNKKPREAPWKFRQRWKTFRMLYKGF